MIEFKKCKGTGKAKGYGCNELVPQVYHNQANRIYGLGKSCGCYSKWLLNTKEGQAKIERSKLKAKKEVDKQQRKEAKAQKEALTDYIPKLQEKVNEIARLLDIGLPCLARGYHANQMHGGHIFSRGAERSMRYNLHNIHRQSAQSNHFQNEDGLLREGLVNEYGVEYFEFLNSLRQTPPLKYTNSDFKVFYKKACSIVNLLKREGRNYNLEQRVAMRNTINLELGIYENQFCIYTTQKFESLIKSNNNE